MLTEKIAKEQTIMRNGNIGSSTLVKSFFVFIIVLVGLAGLYASAAGQDILQVLRSGDAARGREIYGERTCMSSL